MLTVTYIFGIIRFLDIREQIWTEMDGYGWFMNMISVLRGAIWRGSKLRIEELLYSTVSVPCVWMICVWGTYVRRVTGRTREVVIYNCNQFTCHLCSLVCVSDFINCTLCLWFHLPLVLYFEPIHVYICVCVFLSQVEWLLSPPNCGRKTWPNFCFVA